jgi:mercuric ion transport protein
MDHKNSSAKAEKSSKGILGAGLLTAFAASICCITPVLALFSSATGIASTFSWMEPYRPYLIGITIAVLAF